ncbi:TPA: hypothetical protein ACGO00_001541 [Streptococcus suis]
MQNNPANYTDPSGHIWKALTNAYNTAKKAVSKAYNAAKKVVVDTYNTVKKAVVNTYNTIKSAVGHAVNWVGQKVNQAVNWAGNAVRQTTNWIGQQFTSQRGYNNSTRNYVTYQQSEAQRQAIAQQQYQPAGESRIHYSDRYKRTAQNKRSSKPYQKLGTSFELHVYTRM